MPIAVLRRWFGSGAEGREAAQRPEAQRYDRLFLECLRKNNSKAKIIAEEVMIILEEPDWYAIATRLRLLKELLLWNMDGESERVLTYINERMPLSEVARQYLTGWEQDVLGMRNVIQEFFARFDVRVWDDSCKRRFEAEWPGFLAKVVAHIDAVDSGLYALYLPPGVISGTTIRPESVRVRKTA